MKIIVDDEKRLVITTKNYFKQIFESLSLEKIDEALAIALTTIMELINNDLTAPITDWEVNLVLFVIHPKNYPRFVGITILFYQNFRNIMNEDLTRIIN